jgi:tetratricopeptide (TPR) repeat protein
MTKGRVVVGAVAALATATVLLLGGVFAEDTTARPAVFPGTASSLEDAVRARPDDPRALTQLALADQQRWRETADSGYLARSGEALRRALRVAPDDPVAVGALGSLALSRHEFRRALSLGRRAQALAPGTAMPYGVVGDALLELGRYDEAFASFETLAAIRPGLAAYARIAYARELVGRPRAAIDALRLALDAAGGQAEPAAWTHVELGKLYFGLGELAPAERHFRAALASLPGYVFALERLALVEAARGRHAAAIRHARQAVDSVPLPQLVVTHADVLRAAGREAEAQEQDALVGAIDRLLRANGVRTDLELALFRVDRGIDLPGALAKARAARRDRPSVDGDDVLGWALTRNGRCREALPYAARALRLGTQDALKLFHRGMVERCLGRPDAAAWWFRRALDLNPHFSLRWAPVARRYS